ncbi:ISL3 family transposase [Microcoleus sp. B4-C1]|uniref:ISL3 family transposase n=1 Tax=Microcoleus sp. B4-C1 TaxID=2818660 RepID=UPI002FD72828
MDFYLDYILDLPGVKVESCTQIEGRILLGLRILGEGMVCHHCQKYTEQLHQNRPILVRDLPVFGRPVYLKIPRRQFYCPSCQRYPTERIDFFDIKRRHTQRYEKNIYERVKQSSMEQIGREEELSYHEIKGIFERVNQAQKKINWGEAKRISLDEISMRKGQGNFVTVVSDLGAGNLIEMIDSHKNEEIIEVLMEQAIEVREQVEEVSIDMWGGFPKVIKKVFPNAKIVIDRFHVMKIVNKDLNKLRRAAGITDRQSKYLLLSNRVNLNQEQIDKLELTLGKSECLRIAYEMKEEFREIYETNLTVKKGQNKIKEWLNHAQVFFRESASTIENHFEGICNYFLNRTTSGVMEGINNRIKLIMRQGYGFSNFNNFRNRVLACFSD